MKKWIMIGTTALFIAAIFRLILSTQNAIDDDVQAYVAGLHYKFVARVDSASVTNERKGVGFLYCKVISGQFKPGIEDQLAKQLKEHKRLRFIFPTGDSSFKVFLGGIRRFRKSDSVVVDSEFDRFAIFRDNESISESKISNTTVHKVSFAFWLPD